MDFHTAEPLKKKSAKGEVPRARRRQKKLKKALRTVQRPKKLREQDLRRKDREQKSKRRRARNRKRRAVKRPSITLRAPPIIAMARHDSHKRLVSFLRELTRLALIDGKTVEIDFRQVTKLSPDGTLLMFAEIDRILARRPGALICKRARDPMVDETLCHLGIYSMCGFLGHVASSRSDVLHWQAIKGTRGGTEKEIGPQIADQNRLPMDSRKALVKSVGEAITNVTQHAYDRPRMDGTGVEKEEGWWAFVREEKKSFTVVFCDLGLGVPETAPKTRGERIAQLLLPLSSVLGTKSHQDAQIIAATVEDSRTRTGEDNRGKGFRDIMDTLKDAPKSHLQIFSNRGCYHPTALLDGHDVQQLRNYKHSIHGTLIAWRLTFPE